METRQRARPLAPDDRRSAILDAAIPLLAERGRAVSTKEIAEAAGVAEGTVFRAFGDKERLIEAAAERYFDPDPLRAAIRGIDPSRPLEDKLRAVLSLLRTRFTGVIGLMSALGERRPPIRPDDIRDNWIQALTTVFGEDTSMLNADPETVGRFLRLVAFASSIPTFTANGPIDDADLVTLVLHGAIGTPAGAPEQEEGAH